MATIEKNATLITKIGIDTVVINPKTSVGSVNGAVASVNSVTPDESGNVAINDYVTGLTISGSTVTYTKKNGTRGVITIPAGVATGIVTPFAGITVPTGYLLCDGQAVSRTTYSALFAVIGTSYGEGDGSTTFNVPNLIRRFVEGSDTAGTVKEAGLPNITGYFADYYNTKNANYTKVSGCFDRESGVATTGGSGATSGQNAICFDASKSNAIYGNSDTVQPPALTMLYIIKC